MFTDPREELKLRLAELAERQLDIEHQTEEFHDARREVISAALKVGVSASELSSLTGLSRARIYQIRDGRR